jgi:hypothetical protein
MYRTLPASTTSLSARIVSRTGTDESTPWKAGFSGTGEHAVTGVFHGENLRESGDIDDRLGSSNLNQVGLSYEYQGTDLKMTAARSGYVEVYQPTTFEEKEYLKYLSDEILPFVTVE